MQHAMIELSTNKYEPQVISAIDKILSERVEDLPLSISYSGGKDSTAVVILTLLMINIGLLKKKDVTVLHSDTTIEFPLLTKSTFKALDAVKRHGINTLVVCAPIEQRFFACLFAKGYPVPNYAVRWCTDYLKLRPQARARKMLKDTYVLTGEHYGESSNRDRKLSSCGSNDCGQVEVKKGVSKEKLVRPIVDWRDCNVWDFIAMYGDKYLYDGLFNEISNVYEISNDEYKGGSLRTGCIGCPVIHTGRHYDTESKGVPSRLSLKLRLILEEMKNDALRVRNPKKTGLKANGHIPLGSLALAARKYYWVEVKQLNDEFKDVGITLIGDDEINLIDECLALGKYPQTYKTDIIPALEAEWETRRPLWI